jgi:peptidoglycan/LPS O-acetylase OafA/YrhL
MSRSAYFPAIDGLRAIAILLVIAFHANGVLPATRDGVDEAVFQLTSWGWTGVDLFFVISGFLITSILIDMRELHASDAPTYFRRFWLRRFLRIFPAYYVSLAFYFLVLPRLAPSAEASHDIAAAPAWPYLTYVSNFYFVDHPRAPLGFTWSLAVEEQFYVLWPVVVWLLSRRMLRNVVIAILVAAPTTRAICVALDTPGEIIQILTFTRFDAVAMGALLALLRIDDAPITRLGRVAIGVSAPAIVACWAVSGEWHTSAFVVSIGLSLVAVFYAGVVACALPSTGWLTNRALISYGRYSYAIYLYHMAVLGFIASKVKRMIAQPVLAYAMTVAIATVACFAVGWISYVLVEQWFLRAKRDVPR